MKGICKEVIFDRMRVSKKNKIHIIGFVAVSKILGYPRPTWASLQHYKISTIKQHNWMKHVRRK